MTAESFHLECETSILGFGSVALWPMFCFLKCHAHVHCAGFREHEAIEAKDEEEIKEKFRTCIVLVFSSCSSSSFHFASTIETALFVSALTLLDISFSFTSMSLFISTTCFSFFSSRSKSGNNYFSRKAMELYVVIICHYDCLFSPNFGNLTSICTFSRN